MQPTDLFSLAKHSGPYDKWPLKTELYVHGSATGKYVPGYVIEAQYQCDDRYLLVTSWDCPFEEMQTFSLLSKDLSILSTRNYGAPYATVWIEKHQSIAENQAIFYCDTGYDVIITIRDRRPFFFGSFLKMQVVPHTE